MFWTYDAGSNKRLDSVHSEEFHYLVGDQIKEYEWQVM